MTGVWKRFGILMAAGGLLSACTALHPPAPYLPPQGSVMSSGESVTVGGGQNVYAVAQQYKVSMRDLIVLNNLRPPFVLKMGQHLLLPAGSSAPVGGAPQPLSAPSSGVEQAPLAPVNATTSASPVPSSSTISASPLPPLSPASVQAVELPPPPPSAVAPPVSAPSAVEALNAPVPPPKPVTTTVAASKPEVVAAATPVPAAAADGASSASSSISMVWPVQGPVVSGFGPKGQGLSNDGVNIAAPKGAPVVAAANGIVVYAGSEMKGFGHLILIRHQGGWVTAYAHLDRMLVSKDAVVAQGDMIGTVGKTGNVATPQLHFEVRQHDKPVDPKSVIKG